MPDDDRTRGESCAFGDLYGRKRLFLSGMALFTLASMACGAAPSAASLIAARLVQGVGAALMFPQVFALIQALLPEQRRHRAFAVLGAVIGLSTIVGQLVGGLLIQADLFGTGWRPVFWINVPIGLVTFVLAMRLVPESRAPHARALDLPGVAILTVAVFLLVVPLIEGRQAGWPVWTWLSLLASLAVFAAFAAVERRVEASGRDPLIASRLLHTGPFVIGMCVVVVWYAAFTSFFLILSLVLQNGLGLSALSAGLVYTPLAVMFFASSLLAGRLVPRFGRRVLEVGGVLTAGGFTATLIVAATSGAHLSAQAIIPTLLLQGLGEGLLLTPLLNQVLSRIEPDDVGAASGILATGQQIGGALGGAIIGALFFAALARTPHDHPSAYAHAWP